MKDPKDQRKSELPPRESLLSAEYISTPYGRACSKMEISCLRCHKREVIVVPKKALNMIDSEDLAGSTLIEHIAEQKGWLIKPVNRTAGKRGFFMLCPACIEQFFKKFDR